MELKSVTANSGLVEEVKLDIISNLMELETLVSITDFSNPEETELVKGKILQMQSSYLQLQRLLI